MNLCDRLDNDVMGMVLEFLDLTSVLQYGYACNSTSDFVFRGIGDSNHTNEKRFRHVRVPRRMTESGLVSFLRRIDGVRHVHSLDVSGCTDLVGDHFVHELKHSNVLYRLDLRATPCLAACRFDMLLADMVRRRALRQVFISDSTESDAAADFARLYTTLDHRLVCTECGCSNQTRKLVWCDMCPDAMSNARCVADNRFHEEPIRRCAGCNFHVCTMHSKSHFVYPFGTCEACTPDWYQPW